MKLNYLTLAVVVVAAAVFAAHAARIPWTPTHLAGAAIALPAFVLFVVARLQLGSAFSVQAKASTLVTAGLYSRIRNPIYVFGCLMIIGIIVWAQRPWWLLILAVLIPMQVLRVRKEEQVLEDKFGEEYRAYKRQTWF
jgi:protein-S-isoprenylcysteine O-methyltransferase Ste14